MFFQNAEYFFFLDDMKSKVKFFKQVQMKIVILVLLSISIVGEFFKLFMLFIIK